MWPCDLDDKTAVTVGLKAGAHAERVGHLERQPDHGVLPRRCAGRGLHPAIGGDSDDPESLGHKMVKDWNAEYKWTVR